MDQIQEKFITRFFNEFKKPYFWSIFPILVHNNKKKRFQFCHLQLHIPKKRLDRETEGRTDTIL